MPEPTEAASSARGRVLLFVAILTALAALSLTQFAGVGPYGSDAGNYYQIARNIALGRGVVTSVSLYHLGLDPLPQRNWMTYPAWPLLLGYTGRAIGLTAAANILPKLFYILDLILLYRLANTIATRWWGTPLLAPRWPIDLGHVAMALFGTTATFFWTTTHPYTEGPAFALMFGSLLALDRGATRRSVGWFAFASVLAGLAFLTRTQSIALIAGETIAVVLFAIRFRELRLHAGVYVAGVLAALAGWYQFVYNQPPQRVDVGVAQMWEEPATALAWVSDRWMGLLASFSATELGYYNLFRLTTYLVPAAAILYLVRLAQRRTRILPADVSELAPYAVLSSAVIFFASLNLFHERLFVPWRFGWRHGLPYILAIVPAIAYLSRTLQARVLRVGTAAVVAVTIATAAIALTRDVRRTPPTAPTAGELQMIEWLRTNHAGTPTLLTTHAQQLAVIYDAKFHWALCTDLPAKTLTLIERLPIDYVVVYPEERRCTFIDARALAPHLRVVGSFGPPEAPLLLLDTPGRRKPAVEPIR
jgi:hypothetical protein